MSAPPQDLAALLRQTHISSHEDILKAANASLKKSKSDATAQRTRVVALLKLDRFEDALRAFDEGGDSLKEQCALEYAYALYKCGELDRAREVSQKHATDGVRGILHIAGQINYRLERFDDAAEIYETLKSTPGAANEANDLRINIAAVDAQLEWSAMGHLASSRKPQKDDMQGFERAYNAACACIAREELGQAEVLLNRAKQLCAASEDLSEAEKKGELLPITAQQIYVLAREGKEEEALKLCRSIDLNDSTDISTRFLALSNILSITSQENPFLTHRTYYSVPKPSKSEKLFQYQANVVDQNEYVLELSSQKFDGVSRSTSSAISKSPSTTSATAALSVLNAAALTRNETGPKAIKILLPLLIQRPNDIGLLLTITQLYIFTNNQSAAANLLYAFYSRVQERDSFHVAYTPGLVAAVVALFTSQGRSSNARTVLSQAAGYWRSQKDAPPPKALLRDAAAKWLEQPSSSSAAADDNDDNDASSANTLAAALDIFQHLHALDPTDRASTAGLVAAASAQPDQPLDRSLLSQLTPAADLVAGIDAAALEDAGVARLQETAAKAGTKRGAADGLESARQKSGKRKKLLPSRRPKDFVEGKEMDDERWLPMRERSYFRPKGKKGKGKATSGLTQGGVVEEKADTTTKTPAIVGGGGGGQQAKKKKKGKGSKW